MGFDSFGLPAEQYAIETGQHPAFTTEKNIGTFKSQLDKIGFCYDWDREIRTSNPDYYKWTQWIFLQLFKSWFNPASKKAESIDTLIQIFENTGSAGLLKNGVELFTAAEWKSFDSKKQQEVLMNYRLSFSAYGEVNWCEGLGTVLANDEVVNGVSERGGHVVIKKKMRQWYLRITDYADRLLEGLERVDFSDSMKEMQRNWIGKSEGCEMDFGLAGQNDLTPNPSPEGEGGKKTIFTTTPEIWTKLKDFAKENRKSNTVAEEKLWKQLRNNQLGSKVRRQHVIEDFIIDFAFLNEMLLIEVDGGYHNEQQQKEYDDMRNLVMGELGYAVLRFTNEEVEQNIESVLSKISIELNTRAPLSLGRGVGGEVKGAAVIKVYTTRPDTIFGVDFIVLAPEHELVNSITTTEQKASIDEYLSYIKSRSERERMSEKKITGCFTGAYAVNPFNGKHIPIWIAEYVLAGYGTGAIMAVPCGDQRDFLFAKNFNIPITNIIGADYNGQEANPTKEAVLHESGFLNGMFMKDAIKLAIDKIESLGIGSRKVNFKMRDAGFSRQRYWGEPFPIIWEDGVALAMNEIGLPLTLPHVEKYGPGPEGEGPLANIDSWKSEHYETSTMPGYAGSSWYFLRYMDPKNEATFCDRKVSDYWGQVDVYVGGTEHAVGHLLYSRMWTKVLFDLGHIGFDEPFNKLVNQGMIQGSSRFVYRIKGTSQFVSQGLKDQYETDSLHVDVNIVDGYELDTEAFKKWKPDYASAEFILEDGKYLCGAEVEKMSKSKYNTVNPDDLVMKFGADTFRMYEMFLGPIEQSKPWDTKGIEGVHRFLRKLWRLFNDDISGKVWVDEKADDATLKVLHRTIKKIESDTAQFSFNTAVSAFMVCVNELTDLKCNKKEVLEKVLILLAPYAPHIAEEIWAQLGNTNSILNADYPAFEEKYLIETDKDYPVSINGKMRTNISISLSATQEEVEKIVLANDVVLKWLEGKAPKKIIFVKGKMVNVVL
jgi:leucyl-tRNA synthetase